ncbi:hypothetical protein QSE_0697 [Clostridioides difficile P24]|nr:hypothetical protein QCM_0653 [Clostridioides difficile CD46]EQJ51700.1 hypothetical protein QSE_0697 [Clostridioides difficile P24]
MGDDKSRQTAYKIPNGKVVIYYARFKYAIMGALSDDD